MENLAQVSLLTNEITNSLGPVQFESIMQMRTFTYVASLIIVFDWV